MSIEKNLHHILSEIEKTKRNSNCTQSVTLVAATKTQPFHLIQNVYLLGEIPSFNIKYYLNKFDLLLSCYGEGASNVLLANNHKTLEFMSSGKPIVSHYMDEYKQKNDLIQMANEKNDNLFTVFMETVKNIKFHSNKINELKRISFAKRNTYEMKLSHIHDLLRLSS